MTCSGRSDPGRGGSWAMTIALASPHSGGRDGRRFLMDSQPHLEEGATHPDEHAAARCLLHHHPEVLVLASLVALRDGAAELRRLCTLAAGTAIVLVGTTSSEAYSLVARE